MKNTKKILEEVERKVIERIAWGRDIEVK